MNETCVLIEHGTLVSHDSLQLTETPGWLAIEGERIAAIGPGDRAG